MDSKHFLTLTVIVLSFNPNFNLFAPYFHDIIIYIGYIYIYLFACVN